MIPEAHNAVIVAANIPQDPIAVIAVAIVAGLVYLTFIAGRALVRWMVRK